MVMAESPIIIDEKLIAKCGLYCGSCGKYIAGKCPGCCENIKATWCKIRSCCIDLNIYSCADCKTIKASECKKRNNVISKIFSLIFKSDRNACIERIQKVGYQEYAREMSEQRIPSSKRK
jgi:hypothetical protein